MNPLALVPICLAVLPAALHAADAPPPSPRPNIVVILADDLGYGDPRCYNPDKGKIATPNIDRLAAQGMRFTDGHSSSGVCSPSRYSLLTGRYHWRTRLQSGIVDVFGSPLIAPDRLTIAGLAKQHGYRTAAIGKWHLGWDWPIPPVERNLFLNASTPPRDGEPPIASEQQQAAWSRAFSQPIPGGPVSRGFDRYFGTDVPNWPPFCFIENDRTLGTPNGFLPLDQLKNNLASRQGPALKDWRLEQILPNLVHQAISFITDSAKQSTPFLLYLPLTAPHTPIAVNPQWQGKSGMIPYADFVMETDAAIGNVLDALDHHGIAGNTLVFFTSDNGCAPYIGASTMEKMGHFPSGPLRGYKGDAWEGGHRVPFIVRWPEHVRPGTTCGQLVQQVDFMATFAEIFGMKLPENAGEDSFSLLPLLKGTDKPMRDHAINCGSQGVPAFRQGPWKLILAPGSGGSWSKTVGDQPVQLYNLSDDLAETRNLAAEQPERVAAMKKAFENIISNGRSTPGEAQRNDVEVRRYPLATKANPRR